MNDIPHLPPNTGEITTGDRKWAEPEMNFSQLPVSNLIRWLPRQPEAGMCIGDEKSL